MATHPLNLRNRAETGKTRCAQTVPRLFSARLHKFKAPSRARVKQTIVCLLTAKNCLGVHVCIPSVCPLTFLPLMAPWIFVAGRIKRGGCLSEASLPPLPPRDKNPRGLSPSRARLSFAYFSLARQRKVSRPRQGTIPGMDHHGHHCGTSETYAWPPPQSSVLR